MTEWLYVQERLHPPFRRDGIRELYITPDAHGRELCEMRANDKNVMQCGWRLKKSIIIDLDEGVRREEFKGNVVFFDYH